MRISVVKAMIAVLFQGAADPSWALYIPRQPGPETCKSWDCEGGIICSCCFADKGCWICDADGCPGCRTPLQPNLGYCHWDRKASGWWSSRPSRAAASPRPTPQRGRRRSGADRRAANGGLPVPGVPDR